MLSRGTQLGPEGQHDVFKANRVESSVLVHLATNFNSKSLALGAVV